MPNDKLKILLIDDVKNITRVFKKGLEIKGFKVDVSSDPTEAMQQFRPFRYDALITDICMPVLNGFEVYKLIRRQDEKVKVFFMTAFEVFEKN